MVMFVTQLAHIGGGLEASGPIRSRVECRLRWSLHWTCDGEDREVTRAKWTAIQRAAEREKRQWKTAVLPSLLVLDLGCPAQHSALAGHHMRLEEVAQNRFVCRRRSVAKAGITPLRERNEKREGARSCRERGGLLLGARAGSTRLSLPCWQTFFAPRLAPALRVR